MRMLFLICTLGLAACTQFPELEDSISPAAEDADFPALVPLEPLLAANTAQPTRGPEIAASLETRIAGLNARANRLRGAILTRAERARLRQQPRF